jgi:hypothetical protein
MKKLLFTILTIFCLGQIVSAQSLLSTTITTNKNAYKLGETAIATIVVKNEQTATAPFVMTATATWTDSWGTAYSNSATSAPITITRPIIVSVIDLPLPISLEYMPNTAFMGLIAIPATATGNGASVTKLTLNVNTTLLEQQTATILANFKIK